MTDGEYCGLRKRRARELAVLDWVQAYSRVPSILALQRDKVGSD
jgi:hypothetical protein